MTDGGQDFDLGQVVGSDGATGNGVASVTLISTSGKVKTYRMLFTDGTYVDYQVTDGSDASVTIVTSWNSTTSNSKVPSEKLTKDSLDSKANVSSLSTVATSGSYNDLSNKPTIPSSSSDLSDGSSLVKTSSTTGLIKNDGTIDTTSYSTFSGNYNDLTNKPTIPTASTSTPSADTTSGSYGSGTSYARSNHTHPQSSLYAEATHSHTKSQISDFPSIPSKTSDLTNDGADGTNVFVANNDSRLSDARTPTSHTHGNLTNDGKLGTTSGKPVITTTGGAITTGSFGSTSGTFAEGNHTHSGYVSATKVTSWQSTPSDSNVPSEKLVKDYVDGLIGSAISYIVGSGS